MDKYNVTVLNGSGAMINWYPDKTPNEIYQFVQFSKLQDNLIISDKEGNKYSVKEFLKKRNTSTGFFAEIFCR
jgi:hypothetical protein